MANNNEFTTCYSSKKIILFYFYNVFSDPLSIAVGEKVLQMGKNTASATITRGRTSRRPRGGCLPRQSRGSVWPDGCSQMLRLCMCLAPSSLMGYGSTTLHCKMRSLSVTGLRSLPSNPAQSKERKGSNFAILQPCWGWGGAVTTRGVIRLN